MQFQRTDATRKSDIPCTVCQKRSNKSCEKKKKTGDCLIHLNKSACEIEAVLAMLNFSLKSQMAFFPPSPTK